MSSALFIISIVLGLLIVHWLTWGKGIFVPENKRKLKEMYNINSLPEKSKTDRPFLMKNLAKTAEDKNKPSNQ